MKATGDSLAIDLWREGTDSIGGQIVEPGMRPRRFVGRLELFAEIEAWHARPGRPQIDSNTGNPDPNREESS